jgi:hypothetical protein
LAHLSPDQLNNHVRRALKRWGLPRYLLPLFLRAGVVAKNPDDYQSVRELTKEEKRIFRRERVTTFWDETKQLKITIFACCLGISIIL